MRILITAGATREPFDPSLYVGHRAIGAWGIGAAIAATRAGHRVTLLLGAYDRELTLDSSVRVFRFLSTSELRQLSGAHQSGSAVVLNACAMTRFRPVDVSDQALENNGRITMELERTPDLIQQLVPTKREGQRLLSVRIGRAGDDYIPARGVDAEVWQNADDEVVSPMWIDATRRELGGRMDVEAWGKWVVERIEGICRV